MNKSLSLIEEAMKSLIKILINIEISSFYTSY